MRVIYRISTRTSENSNYARHISATNGNPLCRQSERDKALSCYEDTSDKPTCKKCLSRFLKETGYTYEDFEAQNKAWQEDYKAWQEAYKERLEAEKA